jgi:4-hydroxybenzoate polyprenyltransferase
MAPSGLDIVGGGSHTRVALSDRLHLAGPYSLLWFVVAPVMTMALWLRGAGISLEALALPVISLSLTNAGLTTFNGICDRDTDRASTERQRHMRPLAAGRISSRQARAQVVVLEICALVAALGVSLAFFALIAGSAVYGVAYSLRPIHVGGRPLVSQLFWIVLWPAMYLGVYVSVGGDFVAGLPYLAATILFMGVGETLAKDLRDIDNDSLTGKRTTPVAIGVERATAAAFGALVLGSVLCVVAAATADRAGPALVSSVGVVLGLWCGRARQLTDALRRRYVKADACALHMGCIRVFLTINLLFIVGLGTR